MTGDNAAKKQQVPRVLGYPVSIPFIIANEFCERFSYYGMMGERNILLTIVYLNLTNLFLELDTCVIPRISDSVYLSEGQVTAWRGHRLPVVP